MHIHTIHTTRSQCSAQGDVYVLSMYSAEGDAPLDAEADARAWLGATAVRLRALASGSSAHGGSDRDGSDSNGIPHNGDGSGITDSRKSNGTPHNRDSNGTPHNKDSNGAPYDRESNGAPHNRGSDNATDGRDSNGAARATDCAEGTVPSAVVRVVLHKPCMGATCCSSAAGEQLSGKVVGKWSENAAESYSPAADEQCGGSVVGGGGDAAAVAAAPVAASAFRLRHSREAYMANIETYRAALHDGESYEVRCCTTGRAMRWCAV